MILCFGTFGAVLNICKQGLPQDKFIPRVAWVVDRRNSSLASELDFDVDDPGDIEGNTPVVSKLLSCKQSFVLRDNCLPSVEVARERFKSKVMPFINEDMVAKAVLAVRYIISHDDTIGNERKETFKKYMGVYREEFLQQTSFDVPDFFARVLLYTTCVNNKEGKPYVDKINNVFLEKIVDEACLEWEWDTAMQTLELIPTKEKRLSEWVDRLCELRPPVTGSFLESMKTRWIGVKMTGLDPNIWGRTEIKSSDAAKLLARKINPYYDRDIEETPEYLASHKPDRVADAESSKNEKD